ncbi:hypothetical protein JHK87_029661 [Glycine soja]|nr:hypothetical protein JHK87_029661 [Glycine soja]
MPLLSNSSPGCTAAAVVNSSDRKPRFVSPSWRNCKVTSPILRLSQNDKFNVSRLALSHSRRTISMALVGETVGVGQKGQVASSSGILNVIAGTFARRLAQEFPTWQFLLVDLRCHGDSASIKKRDPHTVASAAMDVLKLVRELRITPRVLVGHSFGGKVVLSMVDQAAKPLARPVRAWVLDATPGKVRAGGDGEDHPAELISFLSTLPNEVPSKWDVLRALIQQGFSNDVAQWVVTNLRPSSSPGSQSSSFSWVFDLRGIAEMKIVEDVPRGVHVNFLKAERSLHRWALEDLQRIHAAEELAVEEGGGVEMHVLEDAGHWDALTAESEF